MATTLKELKSIDGMKLEEFREHNINMLFGKVNSLSYGSAMFNLPTMFELAEMLDNKKDKLYL